MARKYLIVGNWKMNPEHAELAIELFSEISRKVKNLNVAVVVCSPSVYLGILASKKKGGSISLGSQNHAALEEGAQTGEISAEMLQNLGVKYALVGHSERRALGETSEMVNQKIKMALRSGLLPIVCLGERVRDMSHNYLRELEKEIRTTFAAIPSTAFKKIVIAYEPVWAIGLHAKKQETPADCTEMIIFIKRVLSDMYGRKFTEPHFLYGGSVHPENAGEFLTKGNVSGLLVGRDSLNAKKFLKIIEEANSVGKI